MENSNLHKRLLKEGFEPLGMFHNVEFAGQSESHYVPPFKKIIEEMHIAFRVIPAYLAFVNAPDEYKNRHIVYISKNISSKFDLLKGCKTSKEN